MARVYTVCDDAYHAKVKAHAKARGLKMQDWFLQVIDDAMRGRKGPDDGIPAELRPLTRKLAEILSSGDVETIDAVRKNIDLFHARLRPAARR